ncbi:MAG: cytochrome c [candidate division KSB1 bacterium]|nr:cytochrome c [candidate division KSB1 bacterium]MDZ7310034.1 cytochrome c [candidate division KSB1 bacterium]
MYCLLSKSSILLAQDPVADFRANCMSCHTIGGGRLTGPDLKNVTQRKDRAWLVQFIQDPKSFIDAGDPYAVELFKAARGVVMPALPGMTKARAEALLTLIAAESKLEKSQFAGVQISERPFTPQDVETGRRIFLGTVSLKNGGPACISCHAVQGIKLFGGGTLAPDLTTVFERYQGRKTLATWLSAPATPTMGSVYKQYQLDGEEILALVAYFQNTLARNPVDPSTARLNFILIGLAGALLVIGFFDMIWNKRLRSVRRALVQAKRLEVTHEYQP